MSRRDDPLEYLLRRRFPEAKLRNVPDSLNDPNHRPPDPKWLAKLQEIRTFEAELRLLSPEKLMARATSAQTRDRKNAARKATAAAEKNSDQEMSPGENSISILSVQEYADGEGIRPATAIMRLLEMEVPVFYPLCFDLRGPEDGERGGAGSLTSFLSTTQLTKIASSDEVVFDVLELVQQTSSKGYDFLQRVDLEGGRFTYRYLPEPRHVALSARNIYAKLPVRVDEMSALRRMHSGEPDSERGSLRQVETIALISNDEPFERYPLDIAAAYIARNGNERYKTILRKLKAAALSGKLPVYERTKNARYEYGPNADASIVRESNEEAYWSDLNDWLDQNDPRIAARFPDPYPNEGAIEPFAGGMTAIDAEFDSRIEGITECSPTERTNTSGGTNAVQEVETPPTTPRKGDTLSPLVADLSRKFAYEPARVWNELCEMASRDKPPKPLLPMMTDKVLAFTNSEGEKQVATRKNIIDRVRRERDRARGP